MEDAHYVDENAVTPKLVAGLPDGDFLCHLFLKNVTSRASE